MGKKKKNKGKGKGKAANKAAAANKDSYQLLAEQGGVAPDAGILERLSSDNNHQREMACATIAVHLFQVENKKIMLLCRSLAEQGVLKRLVNLLSDQNNEVAWAAAKALRNYCLVGHREGCDLLVSKCGDALLQTLRGAFSPVPRKPDLLACVFAIMSSLATHAFETVDVLTQEDVLQHAFKALEAAVGLTSNENESRPAAYLALEAASFLFVVSEDNPELTDTIIKTPGLISNVIMGVMQNKTALDSLRSACAGVLSNVLTTGGGGMDGKVQAQLLDAILTIVGQALQIDLFALASSMIAALKTEKLGYEEKMAANPDDEKFQDLTQSEWGKITEARVSQWKQSAVCVVQILEILTNLGTSEASEKSHEMLAKQAILPKLAAKAGFAPGQQMPNEEAMTAECRLVMSPEETSIVQTFLRQSQRTAVTCMSNLILHLPKNVTGDLSGVLDQAFACIKSLEVPFGQSKEYAIKQIDSLTSLVWNIAKKESPSKVHLQILVQVARASKSQETSVNVAGALGVIGTSKEHFPNNFVIGSVLLGMLESADNLEVACEVANSVIDVYTEDNVHSQQVKQLELLAKLAASVPRITSLADAYMQQDDAVLLERSHETLENITAFIEYKPAHI